MLILERSILFCTMTAFMHPPMIPVLIFLTHRLITILTYNLFWRLLTSFDDLHILFSGECYFLFYMLLCTSIWDYFFVVNYTVKWSTKFYQVLRTSVMIGNIMSCSHLFLFLSFWVEYRCALLFFEGLVKAKIFGFSKLRRSLRWWLANNSLILFQTRFLSRKFGY